jgi:hypothetical protein
MATSHYFRLYPGTKSNEQLLFEDLLNESIKIMGHDIYYLPREDWNDADTLFGENVHSRFDRAYQMEMFIANIEGWEGDGDFFSKFGLEIRDSCNFILTKRTFERYMPSTITRRPREGDLLYVPVMRKIFEIKFVEEDLLFFSKGSKIPYLYELRVEAFRYANEKIDTGVEVIDEIDDLSSYNIRIPTTGTGNYNIGEIVYQGSNLAFSTASAKVVNWEQSTNEVFLGDVKGSFANGSVLIGVSSNTSRTLGVTNLLEDNVYYDLFNNKLIEDEANNFIVIQSNPFGSP